MTSRLEEENAERRSREAKRLQLVCEGGLERVVEGLGARLTGFSCKANESDYLITLRAEFDSGKMISFVGASTLANALLKAYRSAGRNELRWKVDTWD
jgi:hypothetical protein